MSLWCYGDSLTEGSPGHSFVDHLRASGAALNRGRAGDTVLGLAARLRALALGPGDRMVIEVGANDLLFPYFLEHRPGWRPAIERLIANGSIPSPGPEQLLEAYKDLVTGLLPRVADLRPRAAGLRPLGAPLVLVGLPMLGEQPESRLNDQARQANNGLAVLAAELNLAFVDLFSRQEGLSTGSPYLLAEDAAGLQADTRRLRIPGQEEALCRERGLATTVDGLHLNLKGARLLASLVSEALVNRSI